MKDRNTPNHTMFHVSRMLLCGLLVVSVLLARSDSATFKLISRSSDVSTSDVLAYATNMSIGDLLAAANESRAANGLATLQLNNQLNSSAQAKAQHMIANDYWDHIAPDGTEPWYFFDQSGYNYVRAGENLARGFDTGYEANTGWMNSPTHRDNILGDYSDVGFGIASGPNHQGGENTVVVAHYGKPVGWTPPPATTPPPAAPSATSTPTPSAPSNTPIPTPIAQAVPTNNVDESTAKPSDEVIAKPTTPKSESGNNNKAEANTAINEQNNTRAVSVLEQLTAGNASTAVYTSLSLVTLSTAGYALTHRMRLKHLLEQGKKIALHHPMFDIMIIGVSLVFILSATTGYLL